MHIPDLRIDRRYRIKVNGIQCVIIFKYFYIRMDYLLLTAENTHLTVNHKPLTYLISLFHKRKPVIKPFQSQKPASVAHSNLKDLSPAVKYLAHGRYLT